MNIYADLVLVLSISIGMGILLGKLLCRLFGLDDM